MAHTPTTIEEAKVSSNPEQVVFPVDETGFTSLFKKEAVRTIGRIAGNDDKYAVFVATLRVLAKHAAAKMEVQKDHLAQELQAIEDRVAVEVARRAADEAAHIARMKADVASMTAQIDSFENPVPAE